jgi:striatin 1/3/4
MRFLQTEWHRHERDRNAWEIERQEMKSRIAKLEGNTRKLDAGNESLKKFVTMLERSVKDREAQIKALKSGNPVPPANEKKENRDSAGKKELRRMSIVFFSVDYTKLYCSYIQQAT